MNAKERQIWYWQREAEEQLLAWKQLKEDGCVEQAKRAKAAYIRAKETLEELEGNVIA